MRSQAPNRPPSYLLGLSPLKRCSPTRGCGDGRTPRRREEGGAQHIAVSRVRSKVKKPGNRRRQTASPRDFHQDCISGASEPRRARETDGRINTSWGSHCDRLRESTREQTHPVWRRPTYVLEHGDQLVNVFAIVGERVRAVAGVGAVQAKTAQMECACAYNA